MHAITDQVDHQLLWELGLMTTTTALVQLVLCILALPIFLKEIHTTNLITTHLKSHPD